MKSVEITRDEQRNSETMVDFVVYHWMYKALKLNLNNATIFAYIFAHSFDNTHYFDTSLTKMEELFGVCRQTISRNIDRNMPFVKKFVSQEHGTGCFYTYNYYKVDMEMLTELCFKAGEDTYREFINAYKGILIMKFPDDEKAINDYFSGILDWHSGFEAEGMAKIKSAVLLADNIRNNSEDYQKKNFSQSIGNFELCVKAMCDIINNSGYSYKVINTDNTVSDSDSNTTPVIDNEHTDNTSNSNTDNEKTVVSNNKRKGGIKPDLLGMRPKANGKGTSHVHMKDDSESSTPAPKKKKDYTEHIKKLKDVTKQFLLTNFNSASSPLADALEAYIDVRVEKKNIPSMKQWNGILQSLINSYLTEDELLVEVNKAVAGGYVAILYDKAKDISVRKRKKENETAFVKVIDEFIADRCDNNEELRELLTLYSRDIAINNLESPEQFKQLLMSLTDSFVNVSDMIKSVRICYSSGYKRLVLDNFGTNNFSNSTDISVPCVDDDKKEKLIDDFIRENYLYMESELREVLLDYTHDCATGRSATVKDFKYRLSYLKHHCFLPSTMVSEVRDATLLNKKVLCNYDKVAEDKAKSQFGSIEQYLRVQISARQSECDKARKANPNDPRFKDMPTEDEGTVMRLDRYANDSQRLNLFANLS